MGASQLDSTDSYRFDYILLKLASRCNIACTYCYWFRDQSVYEKPAVLLPEVEDEFIVKLARQVLRYQLKRFSILFHGGEPMLIGKTRFDIFCQKLRVLEQQLGFTLQLAITTNGTLVDEEWAALFRQHAISVTVSLDGPRHIHDGRRVDFHGRGTFDKVIAAVDLLRRAGVDPGLLAVCDPASDPKELCDFFIHDLKTNQFDILVPDANHESHPASIAAFYTRLFDLWYNQYEQQGVKIRWIESITKGLLGLESHSESIGFGPILTFTLLTDGSLEPLDVLRTAGNYATRTVYNIFDHELEDIQDDPLWREVRQASVDLPPVCQECAFRYACGGGHIASRYSVTNRYNNPSVYCADFKQILGHAWGRIRQDLYLQIPKEAQLPAVGHPVTTSER